MSSKVKFTAQTKQNDFIFGFSFFCGHKVKRSMYEALGRTQSTLLGLHVGILADCILSSTSLAFTFLGEKFHGAQLKAISMSMAACEYALVARAFSKHIQQHVVFKNHCVHTISIWNICINFSSLSAMQFGNICLF